jgi:nicotinamide mononucleotide (NMN) deamidase PncC
MNTNFFFPEANHPDALLYLLFFFCPFPVLQILLPAICCAAITDPSGGDGESSPQRVGMVVSSGVCEQDSAAYESTVELLRQREEIVRLREAKAKEQTRHDKGAC